MEAPSSINGSTTHKGNYVWGAALTLAWKNLIHQIIKEPIRVQCQAPRVTSIVDAFNNSPVDFNILHSDCYYAMAGFGNRTVALINQEMSKRFPNKTTQKIRENLRQDSIISYAYFFKNLLFKTPFQSKKVRFLQKLVPGFAAKTAQMKKQVGILQYKDPKTFLIQLQTPQPCQQILIYKSQSSLTPQQVLTHIQNIKSPPQQMQPNDSFQMPKINIKHKRTLNDLLGVYLLNQKFKNYFFAEVVEVINFSIDQNGVKVENQGILKMLKSMPRPPERTFHLDGPFWIVMREGDKFPYFVAHVVELEDL